MPLEVVYYVNIKVNVVDTKGLKVEVGEAGLERFTDNSETSSKNLRRKLLINKSDS